MYEGVLSSVCQLVLSSSTVLPLTTMVRTLRYPDVIWMDSIGVYTELVDCVSPQVNHDTCSCLTLGNTISGTSTECGVTDLMLDGGFLYGVEVVSIHGV